MPDEENIQHQPLFREDLQQTVPSYDIVLPGIPSGSTYFFTTGSGLKYEVLFAKKKDNYLENIINFSVLSEEFEDEYSETNRGEVYRVIATVAKIIRIYHENHGYSHSYEFSGEFKDGNEDRSTSIRTLLYYRMAKKMMHKIWDIEISGNKVLVFRKRHHNE